MMAQQTRTAPLTATVGEPDAAGAAPRPADFDAEREVARLTTAHSSRSYLTFERVSLAIDCAGEAAALAEILAKDSDLNIDAVHGLARRIAQVSNAALSALDDESEDGARDAHHAFHGPLVAYAGGELTESDDA